MAQLSELFYFIAILIVAPSMIETFVYPVEGSTEVLKSIMMCDRVVMPTKKMVSPPMLHCFVIQLYTLHR